MGDTRFLLGKTSVTTPSGEAFEASEVRLRDGVLTIKRPAVEPQTVEVSNAALITRRHWQLTDVDGAVWALVGVGGCGCGKR